MTKQDADKTEKKATKIDKKQLIVGGIILLVAILILLFSFKDMKSGSTKAADSSSNATAPIANMIANTIAQDAAQVVAENTPQVDASQFKTVIVMIDTTTEKDVEYTIQYTTDEKEDFNDDQSVKFIAKQGRNQYNIALPVRSIARFQMKFNADMGRLILDGISLAGSQVADMNDFTQYEMFSLNRIYLTEEGELSFEPNSANAFIRYRPKLDVADEVVAETAEENTEAPANQEAETVTEENSATEATSENATEEAPATENASETVTTEEAPAEAKSAE